MDSSVSPTASASPDAESGNLIPEAEKALDFTAPLEDQLDCVPIFEVLYEELDVYKILPREDENASVKEAGSMVSGDGSGKDGSCSSETQPGMFLLTEFTVEII